MSRGKYSPSLQKQGDGLFIFNCYKQVRVPWTHELGKAGVVYDEKTMFGDYDSEGFDRYGYSAFDAQGDYAFCGGVDRLGNTENDYLCMSEEDFDYLLNGF